MPVYNLEQLQADHPKAFDTFLGPVFATCFALRVGGTPNSAHDFSIKCRPRQVSGRPPNRDWKFHCSSSSSMPLQNRVRTLLPQKTITEYAAIAVAAALLSNELSLTISEVGLCGDSGDYWLEDGQQNPAGLIEVGGKQSGRTGSQYQNKRRQVLKNRVTHRAFVSVTQFGKSDGYFCRVR